MHHSITPSLPEFQKLAKKADLVPVCLDVMADTLTPVSVLAAGWKKSRYCFLLESVEGGEKLGRYSIVSFEPEAVIEERGRETVVMTPDGQVRERDRRPGLDVVSRFIRGTRVAHVPGLPRFFGGAVGYLSYETVGNLEKVPRTRPDRLGWAASTFLITGDLFIFDNTQQILKLVTCVRLERGANPRRLYEQACRRLEANLAFIRKSVKPGLFSTHGKGAKPQPFTSNMDRPGFMKAVRKAKSYIAAGDIIQVVLSRRQEKKTTASPLDIYRALRVVNPSPYMYLLKMNDRAIIGSSPEALVRLEDGIASTRPIAGTRRRGETPEKDEWLEKDLLKDPKERAEHLMLVDLGRNDLGRVCAYGTVKVPTFMSIERYSHVMHIVSEVSGKLKAGKDAFDLLRSAFPAGTVAGAPKIRAMEIIDELELDQRGPYAGALGYVSYSGNMDMAITIRTALWDKGRVSLQTGAGIVADSDPAAEYQETENKAAGMKKTIDLAESGDLFRSQA